VRMVMTCSYLAFQINEVMISRVFGRLLDGNRKAESVPENFSAW
jgi:hypothetical protein